MFRFLFLKNLLGDAGMQCITQKLFSNEKRKTKNSENNLRSIIINCIVFENVVT